jgi:hypothetical protein
MTKPGFEPRKIEMRVEHSNHFTIRTLLSWNHLPITLNSISCTPRGKKVIIIERKAQHVFPQKKYQ